MNHDIRAVKTAQIDDDPTYRITTRSDFEDLAVSIRSIGLLHPIILLESSGGFRIVSGFRRIRACTSIGSSEIAARILPADTQALTRVLLAVSDNALQRKLNLLEISRSLNLLAQAIPDKSKLLKMASEFALVDSMEQIEKIMKLCRFIQPIQQGVLEGALSLSMALWLGDCDPAAAALLVRIFSELKLGLNRQRELVTLLTEIAHREDRSLLRVIEGFAVMDILNSENKDSGFKSRALREHLYQRRYPNITARTRAFERLCKKMGLGGQVDLTPPKDFEGTAYSATIRFRNLEELKKGSIRLDAVVKNRDFKKFLAG